MTLFCLMHWCDKDILFHVLIAKKQWKTEWMREMSFHLNSRQRWLDNDESWVTNDCLNEGNKYE